MPTPATGAPVGDSTEPDLRQQRHHLSFTNVVYLNGQLNVIVTNMAYTTKLFILALTLFAYMVDK